LFAVVVIIAVASVYLTVSMKVDDYIMLVNFGFISLILFGSANNCYSVWKKVYTTAKKSTSDAPVVSGGGGGGGTVGSANATATVTDAEYLAMMEFLRQETSRDGQVRLCHDQIEEWKEVLSQISEELLDQVNIGASQHKSQPSERHTNNSIHNSSTMTGLLGRVMLKPIVK
jgi:hypothetical protein